MSELLEKLRAMVGALPTSHVVRAISYLTSNDAISVRRCGPFGCESPPVITLLAGIVLQGNGYVHDAFEVLCRELDMRMPVR